MAEKQLKYKYTIERGNIEFYNNYILINDNLRSVRIGLIIYFIFFSSLFLINIIRFDNIVIMVIGIIVIVIFLLFLLTYLKNRSIKMLSINDIDKVIIKKDYFDRYTAEFILKNLKKRNVLLGFAKNSLNNFKEELSQYNLRMEIR